MLPGVLARTEAPLEAHSNAEANPIRSLPLIAARIGWLSARGANCRVEGRREKIPPRYRVSRTWEAGGSSESDTPYVESASVPKVRARNTVSNIATLTVIVKGTSYSNASHFINDQIYHHIDNCIDHHIDHHILINALGGVIGVHKKQRLVFRTFDRHVNSLV
jgi:hypothetical protein